MANINTIGSKVLRGVFFAVMFAVSGLVSCNGGGGSTTTNTPALPVSLAPSRTSGVAPLAVFFDASGTTDAGVTSRPFHDIEYRWDFGDRTLGVLNLSPPVGGTSTWNEGSRATVSSRNEATGPVAAHVFETPGTYTITLTAFDGANTATTTTTITVQDPEVTFSSTTVCVANSAPPVANTGGCPAGAAVANNADFSAEVATQLAAGKRRILLKRGDTFSITTNANINVAGPGLIGAYGPGIPPAIQTSLTTNIFKFNATSDWRVMDLSLNGLATTTSQGITYVTSASKITVLRLTTVNLNYAVNQGTNELAVVDSNFTAAPLQSSPVSSYGIFSSGGNRQMYMGNILNMGNLTPNVNHNIRVQGGNYVVITNNTSTVGGADALAYRGNTQYGVVSDNKFIGAASPTLVAIQPANDTLNEAQQDVIFERNWFVAGSGTNSELVIKAVGITVRNNIFNVTGAAIHRAITPDYTNQAIPTPAPMTDLVNIYNNTVYDADADINFNVVEYFSGLTSSCHSDVKNNLGYSPNSTTPAPVLLQIFGNCNITGANGTFGNSSDNQIKNTLPFANASPSLPADFSIATGSYAQNTGVTIPVFSDFFRTIRPQGSAIDMGAVEGP